MYYFAYGMKQKLLSILLLFSFFNFAQEIKNVSKNPYNNPFNIKFLGSIGSNHYALSYNVNLFLNDTKDVDEDQIPPKPELTLITFDDNGKMTSKKVLEYEYKFQNLLFAGVVNDHISLVYNSRKAKGTVLENFDTSGNRKDFSLLSEYKKGNTIRVSDSSKFFLQITKENCYVYDKNFKNIDKFPLTLKEIVDVKNYKDGLLILGKNEDDIEIVQYSPNEEIRHEEIVETRSWVYKSPRLSIDLIDPETFYVTYLLGKSEGHQGGWDLSDTRLDYNYRSKGVKINIYKGFGNKTKERSILFESNIIYGTNSNANSEQIMGCTNLANLGVYNFENEILLVMEEQTMKKAESTNQLTGAKKVSHSFQYNDMVFVKAGNMTSIQNFLIKGCHVNMQENIFAGNKLLIKGNKIKILYNQTYLREKKNKLLMASIDMYLDTESKNLVNTFNDSGLNLVLNPTENYVKSKYFLALQTGFLDLVFLEE